MRDGLRPLNFKICHAGVVAQMSSTRTLHVSPKVIRRDQLRDRLNVSDTFASQTSASHKLRKMQREEKAPHLENRQHLTSQTFREQVHRQFNTVGNTPVRARLIIQDFNCKAGFRRGQDAQPVSFF